QNEDAPLPWQFPLEDLEIEASLELTAPDPSLAGIDILADGSDAISKKLLADFGQGWTAPADVPADPEQAMEGYDPESGDPEPSFYQFEAAITGVEPGLLHD